MERDLPRERGVTRWRWLAWGGALLAVVAVVLHAWWWYAPRVRPAAPDGSELTGRLLARGELPVALWVPYPHQNLGALEAALGEGEERRRFLAATARLADLPEPALPGFGPFPAPPSRALVALSDEAGERVFVAARVYPLLALVARLAGSLASNPWLAGGDVEAFGGTARVAWDGTLWTVGTVPLEEVLPAAPPTAPPPATVPPVVFPDGAFLGALRLHRPVSYLPAGTLRLRSGEGGLVLASDAAPPAAAEALLADLPVGEGLALLAVSGPGGPLEERTPASSEPPLPEAGSGDGRGALALFPGAGGDLGELLGDLPGAAAWYLPGGERFRLPVERLLGGSRQEETAGEDGADSGMERPWAVVATSPESLAAARTLTPAVDRLAATTAVSLAADPGQALLAVDAVTGVLRVVPIASSEEVRRWQDWRTVLTPLARFDRLTVVATGVRPVPPALPPGTEVPPGTEAPSNAGLPAAGAPAEAPPGAAAGAAQAGEPPSPAGSLHVRLVRGR